MFLQGWGKRVRDKTGRWVKTIPGKDLNAKVKGLFLIWEVTDSLNFSSPQLNGLLSRGEKNGIKKMQMCLKTRNCPRNASSDYLENSI